MIELDKLRKIKWKQGKYIFPAILYPCILGVGWLVFDIFHTEIKETAKGETTEYLNPNLPKAQLGGKNLGSKQKNMQEQFGRIRDFTAVEDVERDTLQLEGYESRYTDKDLAYLDSEAEKRLQELQEEMERQLRAGEPGTDRDSLPSLLTEEEVAAKKLADLEAAKENLEKEVAQLRLQASTGVDDFVTSAKVEVEKRAVETIAEDEEAVKVVRSTRSKSDYFNTLKENTAEPNLIKAIIDEDIKAVDGSRVRLRLLDEVEIDGVKLPEGSYLYATMSGFSSQRVKGTVKSLLVADELVRVNLSIYDMDGLEGLYVPSSSFRETMKDVGGSALDQSMTISNGSYNNNFAQWGMQAIQNAYQRTSNALSRALRKNKAKLKYGTFVYLVNGREKAKN